MSQDPTLNQPVIPRLADIAFGGDWNPEQWPEATWVEDLKLMKEAGVNLVTIGVFSWAIIQPDEESWNFAWLDKLLDMCLEAGVHVDLATATASPPPWLSLNYPDSNAVTADGMTLAWGARQHYSPSSKVFQEKSQLLVQKMVERYKDHEAVVMWHIGNEYGAHTPYCYSKQSEVAFREWLIKKHKNLDTLNDRWGTRFWSQQYSSWDQVMPPRTTAYFPNPSQQLDFKRFSSDAMLALYKKEHEIIRSKVAEDIPITTNFMRLFPHADYWKWAQSIDVISDDWYPDPSDPDHQIESSLGADLMRSLKLGKPWLLMEQAPSAINWRAVNGPKVNGSYSRWSIQQVAHGADGILHFQWRASLRGAEKWHSGMVPHSGTDTRVWNEVRELGNQLKKLAPVVGSTTNSKIALLLDWNSWWALELDSRPSTLLRQRTFLLDYYRHFFELGYSVDFAHPEQDLSKYKLVIAPNLYLATDKAVSNIRKAISSGVNFVLGAFSIAVDEDEGVRPGGHLIDLRDLFGAYSEEWSPLYADGAIDLVDGSGKLVGKSEGWAEYMKLDPEAEVVLSYSSGALENLPAVVKKQIGANSTWILSCRPDHSLMRDLLKAIISPMGIAAIDVVPGSGVEVAKRENQNTEFYFLMNHTPKASSAEISKEAEDLISGEKFSSGSKVSVPAGGWRVLSSSKV